MKRTPVKKSIERFPVKHTGGSFLSSDKKKINRTPVSGPLILSKKNPHDDPEDYRKEMIKTKKRAKQKFIKEISTECGYIERLTDTNLEPTILYKYQQDFISDRTKYRHCDKSRQVGQSYGFSCEGYAKAQLMNIYTGIFVSYNQEEANEKIVYARNLYQSTPFKYRKKLVVDRITALEFEGRLPDGRTTRTRLLSHPQREPRGKGYNTDVFLDEMAHYQWQDKVYVASVPIVTRGFGQLSVASTPLGKSGLYYSIGHDVEKYSMFSRHKIYWWDNPDFLNEDALKNFKRLPKLASEMETVDRVFEFGNDAIIQAYNSMLIEDFCQEYEITPIDESVSYYPMDLIRQCTFDVLKGLSYVDEEDTYGDNPVYLDPVYPGVDFKTYESPEALSHAIAKGDIGKTIVAGFDIGRNENNSEILLLEEIPLRDHLQIVRLVVTLNNIEFRKQYQEVLKLFSLLPIKKMKVDSTGIGKNLGEDLRRKFHSRIDDMKFTNENKGDMATNFKLRLEDQSIAYPNDRDIVRQIHSIKRTVSGNSVIKYEADGGRKHHGDKFWALAMASAAGEPAQMHKVKVLTANKAVVDGTSRLLTPDTSRAFGGLPSIVLGTNYRKLMPPPPKHFNDADMAAIKHDAMLNG